MVCMTGGATVAGSVFASFGMTVTETVWDGSWIVRHDDPPDVIGTVGTLPLIVVPNMERRSMRGGGRTVWMTVGNGDGIV
jgi:hypothetical protein